MSSNNSQTFKYVNLLFVNLEFDVKIILLICNRLDMVGFFFGKFDMVGFILQLQAKLQASTQIYTSVITSKVNSCDF